MREDFRLTFAVLTAVAVAAACHLVPLLLAREIHPAVGLAAASGALFLWTKAVRPMPGSLQGFVALTGVMLIVGSLLLCLVMWMSRLWT